MICNEKLFIVILFLLFPTGCVTKPWTRQEKILLAISWVTTAADAYTTIRFLNNPDNYEMNPIIGKHPSNEKVIFSTAISQIATTIICHYIPSLREPILGFKLVFNIGFAINNTTLDWNERR